MSNLPGRAAHDEEECIAAASAAMVAEARVGYLVLWHTLTFLEYYHIRRTMAT